ncbi:MAG TPA: hypothetical protein PKG48_00405 [Bacteroidales bacterium]|nr:hypothetical protein [Bacteroidales bacterium]HPS62462.1 hypothetical protein [Bacteroidales bacterium]
MTNEFLIPIAFFGMVYGIVYLFVRNKERLALINKGANATIFDSSREHSSMKWGLLFVGIGTGILLGKVVASYTTMDEEPAYFSMICLLGGIGLIAYHLLARKFEGPADR